MRSISFESAHGDNFISGFRFEAWFLLCLVIGSILAAFTKGVDSNLVFTLFLSQRSAAMLAISVFLPLGLTCLACYFRSRGLLLLTIFCKVSLFSYAVFVVARALPNAGWLIVCLLLAGGWLSLIAYHQLWLRCFIHHLKIKPPFYFIILLVLFVIFLCEYSMFQPFAESLFINL